MSNEEGPIVFLILIYALGQLESFLLLCYMKIDFNQIINISLIYDNLGSEIFDVVSGLHAITGRDTTSYKVNVEKLLVFKKALTDPSTIRVMNGTSTWSRFTCWKTCSFTLSVMDEMWNGIIMEYQCGLMRITCPYLRQTVVKLI